MTYTPSDTVVLLFAHTAHREARRKTLVARQAKNQQVARLLLRHTERVLAQSGLPLMKVFSEQQTGRTFGERLANAFHDAFAAGFQRVICVGSDCPSLDPGDLQTAAAYLEQHQLVLGPAADGGAFLIGMHLSSFCPEDFTMLNWQTNEVLDELKLYAYRQHASLNSVALLPEKADVDSAADMALALRSLPAAHALRRKLQAVLCTAASHTHQFLFLLAKPLELHLSSLLLRAPPL